MNDDRAGSPNAEGAATVDQYVGRRVRMLRGALCMSLDTIARALQTSASEITRWEEGAERVPAYQLLKLSELLSCPLKWFFEDLVAPTALRGTSDCLESSVDALFNHFSDVKH